MTEQSAAFAMAAAVAAAAELAKNGGMNLFELATAKQQERERSMGLVSISPEPQYRPTSILFSSNNHRGNASAPNVNTNVNHNSSNGQQHLRLQHVEEDDDDDALLDNSDANRIHESEHISGEEFEEEEGEEEGAEKRLARSRERNREHARRTRLRKKAQLDALQTKAKGLEEESIVLKQSIEECSIASILMGISSTTDANKTVTDTLLDVSNFDKNNATGGRGSSPKVSLALGGKRKRFISEDIMERAPQPLKLNIDGQSTLIGGSKTHINWKSGMYCDENGVQRQLTQEQLESLRRERNRMHAKMTRDRKKGFIAAIEKTIEHLESKNKKMKAALTQVAKHHFGPNAVTPQTSPLVTGMIGNLMAPGDIQDTMSSPILRPFAIALATTIKPHRVPHGFSLTGP